MMVNRDGGDPSVKARLSRTVLVLLVVRGCCCTGSPNFGRMKVTSSGSKDHYVGLRTFDSDQFLRNLNTAKFLADGLVLPR